MSQNSGNAQHVSLYHKQSENKTKTNEVVIHRHGSDQQIPLKSSIKKATYNFRVFRQQHTYIATGKDTRFTVQKKAKIGIASRLQKCTNTERYNHQQLKEGANQSPASHDNGNVFGRALSVTVSCTEMTKCVHSLHNKNKQKAIGLFHRLLFMKYGLSLLSTQREKALDIKYDDEWAYDENEHMMNEHIMNEHDE